MSDNDIILNILVDNNILCIYNLNEHHITQQVVENNNYKNITFEDIKSKNNRYKDFEITLKRIKNDQQIEYESEEDNSNVVFINNVPILYIKVFVDYLQSIKHFRRCACNYFNNIKSFFNNNTFVLEVFTKDSCVIDYSWDYRLWRQIRLAIERECAAAWLSTLGGAFSALGEQSDRCAKMALNISLKQIKLSIDSKDADGISRGWLFMALALSQLGHSKVAFHLLNMASNAISYDDKHKTMCLGVEVKLKYDRKVRKQRRAEGILQSPESLEKLLKSMIKMN